MTEEEEMELAGAESALWRVTPNTYTIPCGVNGFAAHDPFEGVGETYRAAYERLARKYNDR